MKNQWSRAGRIAQRHAELLIRLPFHSPGVGPKLWFGYILIRMSQKGKKDIPRPRSIDLAGGESDHNKSIESQDHSNTIPMFSLNDSALIGSHRDEPRVHGASQEWLECIKGLLT